MNYTYSRIASGVTLRSMKMLWAKEVAQAMEKHFTSGGWHRYNLRCVTKVYPASVSVEAKSHQGFSFFITIEAGEKPRLEALFLKDESPKDLSAAPDLLELWDDSTAASKQFYVTETDSLGDLVGDVTLYFSKFFKL